jgi:hypothetical protein
VTRTQELKQLEARLERFLSDAVTRKEARLDVVSGINRLDNIARGGSGEADITAEVGNWFASYNRLLSENKLKPTDTSRINIILARINNRLSEGEETPARRKIASEIQRWQQSTSGKGLRIVLKRSPEKAPPVVAATPKSDQTPDTLEQFREVMKRLQMRFEEHAASRQHVLSALDDALKSAELQNNREALLLSALMIYYLKQKSYKVEPYVARLRTAELQQKGGGRA